jgi:hypothetical protein
VRRPRSPGDVRMESRLLTIRVSPDSSIQGDHSQDRSRNHARRVVLHAAHECGELPRILESWHEKRDMVGPRAGIPGNAVELCASVVEGRGVLDAQLDRQIVVRIDLQGPTQELVGVSVLALWPPERFGVAEGGRSRVRPGGSLRAYSPECSMAARGDSGELGGSKRGTSLSFWRGSAWRSQAAPRNLATPRAISARRRPRVANWRVARPVSCAIAHRRSANRRKPVRRAAPAPPG